VREHLVFADRPDVHRVGGQLMIVYHAEPNSPSAAALALLGSMAAPLPAD
jgi:hypothetical protein